ncbi:MAG: PBP1A family penicillin-binding protein [Candidatus Wallbacteria bacterium]|nr:PBP1A family penicillin-binding protein [Candidatus Wallbacteria bacterium]
MKKFIVFLFFFAAFVFLALSAIAFGAVYGVYRAIDREIPDISIVTYQPRFNSQIFDCKGRLITELHGGENRSERVRLNDMAQELVKGVVAIEDERFYQHHGIDPLGILRAVYVNHIAKRTSQGGSTITQQLARNAFLSTERTMRRKIREAIVAFKIEQLFTKSEILEYYLNEIYFGPRAYGIASAARAYFNKVPSELNLLESALLAGIIRNPSYYSPYRNPTRALNRASVVLSKMLELGMITQSQVDAAKKLPLILNTEKNPAVAAPHFIYEFVLPYLMEQFSESRVLTDGLKIYTTLDLDLQQAADAAFSGAEIFTQLQDTGENRIEGALVCLDTRTSKIKAMVGGKNYFDSKFNRATSARRQLGSSFKPFVYLAAFIEGCPPGDIVMDIPKQYEIPQINQIWQPRNYENNYHGPTTLINALVGSYNIATIELLCKIGFTRVIETAQALGMTSRLAPTLSLALGAYEATPLELAECYASLARLGITSSSFGIERVEDKDGNLILANEFKGKEAVPPGPCYVLIDILKKAMVLGTGTRGKISAPSAGKTGTTDDYTNAWFCGFTPDLTCVTYIGYDTPITMGEQKSGGRVAAPIWKEFMEKALVSYSKQDFPVPNDIVMVKICKDSGLLATSNCQTTMEQAFIKGAEPLIGCNFHSLESTFYRYEEDESGMLQQSNYPSFEEYQEMMEQSEGF